MNYFILKNKPPKKDAVFKILETTEYADRGEVGIDRLITEGIVLAAYPPHDGDPIPVFKNQKPPNHSCSFKSDNLISENSPRTVLNNNWSSYLNWYKYQPIDLVKNYFGEKIAFYFAWLGAYTTFLIIPAIVGVIVFIINFLTRENNISS